MCISISANKEKVPELYKQAFSKQRIFSAVQRGTRGKEISKPESRGARDKEAEREWPESEILKVSIGIV